MPLRLRFALLVIAASVSVSWAKEPKHDPISSDISEFPALRAEIEEDLKGDDYSELTRTQREEVIAALDRMEKTLDGVTSIEELAIDERNQLFNDQSLVNTVLTKARADSRTICRAQQRTGSHRLNQHCRTVAEIQREREQSQDAMRRFQRITLPQKQ